MYYTNPHLASRHRRQRAIQEAIRISVEDAKQRVSQARIDAEVKHDATVLASDKVVKSNEG